MREDNATPKSSENEHNFPLLTEEGTPMDVPREGSLGLLAMGYVGIMLWRQAKQAQPTFTITPKA
jgi:hypothetical protein